LAATIPAAGTVVEQYCRKRGINNIPPTIRCGFLNDRTDIGCQRWPALTAAIQDINGNFVGITCVALAPDGTKAPIAKPKRTYGILRGNAVHLAEPDDQLILAEGVETALSVAQVTGVPAWAALGVNNLEVINLPPTIREVLIAADADQIGLRAAQRAGRRLAAKGYGVRIAVPEPGYADFNDMLTGIRA
jgi:phage/plasmid primase-like uncharacterized protein